MDIFDIGLDQINAAGLWERIAFLTGNIVSKYGFYIIYEDIIVFIHWKDVVILFLAIICMIFIVKAQRRKKKLFILQQENNRLFIETSELQRKVLRRSTELLQLRMEGFYSEDDFVYIRENKYSEGPNEKAILQEISDAINSRSELIIKYRNERGVKTFRRIQPIQIDYRGRQCYVKAWCRLRNAERNFRVDRISGIAAAGDERINL